MKTLRKMNGNKYLFYLLVAGIFGIMFLLNHYTFYAADDYSYMNSFATHKKIQTVWDIFPSMYAHAKGMNGRLVAHFFVQLFLLLPSGIFDVVNAVIFTMLILILYRYLFWNKKRNALALVSIFGLVWYFAPAFGQTMLWLDGSCNYLWGCTFSLYYLYPFMKLAKNEKVMEGSENSVSCCRICHGRLSGDSLLRDNRACGLITGISQVDEERKNSGMGNGKCLDDAGRISFYDDGTGYIEK